MRELVNKLNILYQRLYEPFVGREEEAKVLILALLTREHVVLIGEPGTGKSALARRLASLVDAKFFKYLLTKFTEPSEIFGPLDIAALKSGEYKRVMEGKLPEAEIAFLDEIFNANSAVLNSLLSIMQERIVYDGYGEIKTNIWSIIGAANNVPEEPELEALYDRFVFRHIVSPVSPEKWGDLLEKAWIIEQAGYESPKPLLTLEDISILKTYLFNVNINYIKSKLIKLFVVLEQSGIHITDRRKGKILKAIAAHALLEGRTEANLSDLTVLKYTAPGDPDEFDKIKIILNEELKTKDKIINELNQLLNNLNNIENDIKILRPLDSRLLDYYRTLKSLKNKVRSLVSDEDDEEIIEKASKILEKINEIEDLLQMKINM